MLGTPPVLHMHRLLESPLHTSVWRGGYHCPHLNKEEIEVQSGREPSLKSQDRDCVCCLPWTTFRALGPAGRQSALPLLCHLLVGDFR